MICIANYWVVMHIQSSNPWNQQSKSLTPYPSGVFFQVITLASAPWIITPRVKCQEIEDVESVEFFCSI